VARQTSHWQQYRNNFGRTEKKGMNNTSARVVADADVLAADLLVGGDARAALDIVREHSWMELVASDQLCAEAQAIIELLADPNLAAAWREKVDAERIAVDHPDGDHPALASAYRGNAAHVLSYDDRLTSAQAGVSLQSHLRVSVRTPDAFVAVVDPAGLYEATVGESYPGPDRDPRT
jgi:predicted nucleic acid-binding protein